MTISLYSGTCQPYCRSLPEDSFLECLELTRDSSVKVRQTHCEAVKSAIRDHHSAVEDGLLLKLPFTTIFEYLQSLQLVAISMKNLGSRGMFYLAAAVSDFYVPWESMTEHKIQSASGPLDMRLSQLETDSNILLKKADMALRKYKMNVVVANELSTRKEEVTVISTAERITVRKDKILACKQLTKAEDTEAIPVGVIMDMESWTGKVSTSCMSMAISDFYSIHGDYKTRLVLHTSDSKMDATGAAFAAMELLKNPGVQVIIGPQKSVQTEFIVDIGENFHIPIISFSATSPSLYSRSPYFVRTTPDDHTQVKAIASVAQAFGWRKVILIHEDTDYGNRLIPHLINAFQDINTHILYRSAIPQFATDDHIYEELHKLMVMHTSVFIVHMSAPFGSQFFLKAKEMGMMTEGYVWIITNGLMNVLESLEPTVLDSMQGVLGVNPYIPKSKRLDSFITRWKRKFIEENPGVENAEMISFGLWAYDTVWALALAAERVGDIKSDYIKLGTDGKPPDLLGMRVSKTGPKVLQEILKIEFEGLSGEFRLVNGQLQPCAFQILNVIGKGGREIGFWTSTHGLSRNLHFHSERTYITITNHLRGIIWPGESTNVPKGWVIPVNGKKLRIGVPVPDGFSELVKVEIDPHTNATKVSGYCIDVFDSAIRSLPYNIPYEYVPFHKDGGKSGVTYNDIIDQVYLQNYDAVVGDITITLNRSLYVDFAFPYTNGGVWMIVPLKKPTASTWMFMNPLAKDIGFFSMIFFIFTGFLVWVLEQVNEFRGTSAYPHVEKIVSIILSTVTLAYSFVYF
ncbi:Glutamate receptor [Thalictrum thalictroides]|uniref:Glutamate receptor n=1 Tax=Thalictrum thalictroides TaxID=46969 RepID=A0A7J6URS3_THATH|nr:Glutamate receptor [Thalictrum thalictroides]